MTRWRYVVANLLFVDIDGTLITEDPETGKDVIKADVVAAVKYHEATVGDIRTTVIWTGGGEAYARLWADRLFPDLGLTSMAKDVSAVCQGDVVVDDATMLLESLKRLSDAAGWGLVLLTPEQFVVWVHGGTVVTA